MEKTTPKDKQKAVASFRLKIIDVFFAAYGAFISGLFCISQYFWGSSKYFVWIASTFFFVTLLATYILSYSKKTAKSETLLRYIQECANYVGVLNPVMLALGFILTISSDVYILAFCIVLEAVQLCCYFWSVKKVFPCLEFGFWNKIVTWCKRNKPLIITILFGLISGAGWFFTTDNRKISDLCLNLFAGFISSGITIGVIDRIIRRQQEVKDTPIKKALYRDVQLFTSRLIGLWTEMYVQSTEDRSPLTLEELFDPTNVVEIGGNLDLEGFPNITPKQNWFSYIEHQRKDLSDLGEKILSTYINIADPELIQAIHYLVNDSAYIGYLRWIGAMRAYDNSNNVPRPALLGWYTMLPQETDYVMVKQLISWCKKQFKLLHKKDQPDSVYVYPIAERITIVNPNTPPTSVMPKDKKFAAFDAFKVWQDASKAKNSKT